MRRIRISIYMLLCPAFKITHMKIFIFEKMILRRITFILYTLHLTLKKKVEMLSQKLT